MKRRLWLVPSPGEAPDSTERHGRPLTVDRLMTRPVVVVSPAATFGEIANLLRRHRISGLPVVDDEDRLVGMVSESDLMRRLVREEVRRLFPDQAPRPAGHPSRATADTAGALMSQPAISISPGASADEALRLMRRRGVRRLPVIEEEGRRVIGIVSRTDLLQPYACTDEELLEEVRDGVLPGLGVDPGQIRVDVDEGSVLIGGTLADPWLVEEVEQAVRDTPGVVQVESRLRARRHPSPRPSL
jgi:CBS domain-containing protein